VIVCTRDEHLALVGDRAVLSCDVSANPGSQLTWTSSDGDQLNDRITDPAINLSIKVRTVRIAFNTLCGVLCDCNEA